MAQLMLVCSNNHVFPSGFDVDVVYNLTLSGNQSQCPYDGESVDWPEGTFNVIDGIMSYVQQSLNPALTAKELSEELKIGGGKHVDAIRKANPQTAIDLITGSIGALKISLDLLGLFNSHDTTRIDKQTIINTYNTYYIQQQNAQGLSQNVEVED